MGIDREAVRYLCDVGGWRMEFIDRVSILKRFACCLDDVSRSRYNPFRTRQDIRAGSSLGY